MKQRECERCNPRHLQHDNTAEKFALSTASGMMHWREVAESEGGGEYGATLDDLKVVGRSNPKSPICFSCLPPLPLLVHNI